MKWQKPQTSQCLQSEIFFFFFLQDRKHDFFGNDKHQTGQKEKKNKTKKTRNVVRLSHFFLFPVAEIIFTLTIQSERFT